MTDSKREGPIGETRRVTNDLANWGIRIDATRDARTLAGIQWTQGSAAPTDAEFERLAQSVRGYLSRSAVAPAVAEAAVASPPAEPPVPAVETPVEQVIAASPEVAGPPPATDAAEALDSPSATAFEAAMATTSLVVMQAMTKCLVMQATTKCLVAAVLILFSVE